MNKSCIKVESECYHKNRSKTEKQSYGTNFLNWKLPSNDKIEYDTTNSLYKKGKGNNGNAPNGTH